MTKPPALSLDAFDCPHCGAYAQHYWFIATARRLFRQNPACLMSREKDIVERYNAEDFLTDEEKEKIGNNSLHDYTERCKMKEHGLVAVRRSYFLFDESNFTTPQEIWPVWISSCVSCNAPSIWIDDRIIWPITSRAPLPNRDLPADVLRVYEEARSILELSPVGAAALLRKALEMFCVSLGANTGNLWCKIEKVMADYPQRVRDAAHAIRLFGNDQLHVDAKKLSNDTFLSVHEDDDMQIAEGMFELMNFLADYSVTMNKKIDALYIDAKKKI